MDVSTGNNAAAYWLGPLSRKEAQPIFDEYSGQIGRLLHTVTTMDVLLQFIIEEKLKLDMNEFKEYVVKRAAAVQAAAEATANAGTLQPAPVPVPKNEAPTVTLD